MSELAVKPLTPGQVRMFKAIMRPMTRLNVWIYQLSGGKMMNTLQGSPVCLVTMTGRKTGKKRTIALMHTARGEDIILVASMGGAPKSPLWYHNMVATPQVDLQVGATKRSYSVRQASDEEKAELWPLLVDSYGDFDMYQKRTHRNIPVLICSPTG